MKYQFEKLDSYSNLPVPKDYEFRVFIVLNDEEDAKAGLYKSDGISWNYIGNISDVGMLLIGNDIVVGNPLEICEGKNITINVDEPTNKIIISAPMVNKTNIKHEAFLLSGDFVEIVSGPGIKISTYHPNKITIGADSTKELMRIIELEKRIENLEKAFVALLKKDKK